MLDPITLTARVVDATHFVFVPQTWEKELKPYKSARFPHDTNPQYGPHNYDIKEGHFLAFVQFDVTQGGFYAAHLYAALKELSDCRQISATITQENGLVLETIGGEVKTRITLKPRGFTQKDTPHSVRLDY